jgi:valyl-tRNA synthetase
MEEQNNAFEFYKGPYDPNKSEVVVLNHWLTNKYYKPEYNPETQKLESTEEMKALIAENPDKKFTIIDPPPNAYDRPHVGNISGYAYQDLLGRFWRQQGKRVLLFPGKDHAGIQGEVVVLRDYFRPKGITKKDISREDFYKQTYEYFVGMMEKARKDEQRIGLSADFDRDVFTLDPEIVKNVLQTFVNLYEDKKVYKGVRIVNWCPSCQTALADIDTEKKDREGKMYYINYPIKDSNGEYITVATTRPETMLGDTAIVVHPEDERYKKYIGKTAILPLLNRELPIITDPIIDRETGTGALKLTPAHAPEDYEIMLRWNAQHPDRKVDMIAVIDKNEKMAGPAGKYAGMHGLSVHEAIPKIVDDLKHEGYFQKEEDIVQRIPVCERCKTVVQPILSSQWFIDVAELKKFGADAVESGEVKIHPKYMTKKYLHWINNLRDWPISRSLWWGYRIPAWYKGKVEESIDKEGRVVETISGVEVTDFNDAVTKGVAKISLESPGEGWIQDEDVFDTWFSSGQWPYVTLQKEDLFDTFYPTDVMETGYDILEFWVSRMIMLGKYRTGKYPFKDVYLHGIVKAADGQKMSKSKGNNVTLDELVNEFGADVVRLWYILGNKAGASYRVDKEKMKGHRNFLNKLWNASRFVINNVSQSPEIIDTKREELKLTDYDEQMLKQAEDMAKEVASKIKTFKFGLVALDLYQSFWRSFCDEYIESVKHRLYTKDREGNPINQSPEEQESRKAAQWTLWYVLGMYLKMLHPYIPFITEFLWQSYPKATSESRTIMYAKWPIFN